MPATVGMASKQHPSVPRRPGYPSAGCAPAEPASVSPGAEEIPPEAGSVKAREPGAGQQGRAGTAKARTGRARQGRQAAPDVPGLRVKLVTVRVP